MPLTEIKRRAREIFRISAPVMAEQSFVMLMGFVSSVLVASVGEHAVAAVAMVDTISNLIIAFYAALTTGGTIVVAQYIGRKDIEKAKGAAGQAFLLSMGLSAVILIFFAIFGRQVLNLAFSSAEQNVMEAAYVFLFIVMFSYPFLAAVQTGFGILRGSGDTRTPMMISILMNIINLIFGIVLIRGVDTPFLQIPSFGVAGAAAGLLIARIFGALMCGYFLCFRANVMRLNKLSLFKPSFEAQKAILRLGVPTSIESSLFQLGKVITMMFVVNMGTYATAANAIASTLLGIINVAGMGFATGVMVLCGQKIGRGETDDIRRTALFASLSSMVVMFVVCLVMFILFQPIVSIYDVSPDTYIYLRQLMFSVFVMQVLFWPWSFITPAALRATGDVRYTMSVSIVSMWAGRIVIGYVLGIVLGIGVFGVWMGVYIDWMIRGGFFNWRLRNGKWQGKAFKA